MTGVHESTVFQADRAQNMRSQMLEVFRKQGFLVVEGVFSESECAQFIEASEYFLERQPESERYKPLMNPDRENPVLAGGVRHKALVPLAEILLGSRVEAVQTQFFWKPPGALGHDAHQDNFYVGSTADGFIAAWVALEDTGPDNGGMIVYPGSHREPILPVRDVEVPVTARPLYPNQRGIETVIPPGYEERAIEVKKGGVAFFHGHLVHRSYDNNSPVRFRRALLVDYIQEGAPFAIGRFANRKRISVY